MWVLIGGEGYGELEVEPEDISPSGNVLRKGYEGAWVIEVLVKEVWVRWEDYKKEGE